MSKDELPGKGELPVRRLSANQLVAHNIGYFRRGLHMTQEQVAEVLTEVTGKPWSKVTVSAAERSVDGGRVRQFDADDLLGFAQALRVPIPAFFLPPWDDGDRVTYQILASPNGRPMPITELVDHLFPTGRWGEDNLLAYRGSIRQMLAKYAGASGYDDIGVQAALGPEMTADAEKRALAGDLNQAISLLRRLLWTVEHGTTSDVDKEAGHP